MVYHKIFSLTIKGHSLKQGPRNQDPELKTQDPRPRSWDLVPGTQDPRFRTQDSKIWDPGTLNYLFNFKIKR